MYKNIVIEFAAVFMLSLVSILMLLSMWKRQLLRFFGIVATGSLLLILVLSGCTSKGSSTSDNADKKSKNLDYLSDTAFKQCDQDIQKSGILEAKAEVTIALTGYEMGLEGMDCNTFAKVFTEQNAAGNSSVYNFANLSCEAGKINMNNNERGKREYRVRLLGTIKERYLGTDCSMYLPVESKVPQVTSNDKNSEVLTDKKNDKQENAPTAPTAPSAEQRTNSLKQVLGRGGSDVGQRDKEKSDEWKKQKEREAESVRRNIEGLEKSIARDATLNNRGVEEYTKRDKIELAKQQDKLRQIEKELADRK
jgi:hypothetical protein